VTDTDLGKLFEVLPLLGGLAAFVWWQMRDLKRAKAESLAKKAQAAQAEAQEKAAAPDPNPPA
jgi:hypothetical protein